MNTWVFDGTALVSLTGGPDATPPPPTGDGLYADTYTDTY